uniref:GDP-L-galactose phosphorylase 2 isoform X2 n=1 Tax=Elaeis guineensis var. tenera TaxID=51953 RepID=A0A6I9QCG4_ELAGV|nr:GDP-L-galactose phosphorylase 2 isoform X2 [Elaeis guineensis]
MVSVTQVDGEYPFLKQNTGSEQSKCHKVPFTGNFLGIRTHVYWLGSPTEGNGAYVGFPYAVEERQSLLDALLLSQWEDHAWKGQLNYDVTACEIKVVSGEKNFVTQLNENWHPNFLTEFENNVFQPLEPIKSSCMKICEEDILCCAAHGEKESSVIIPLTMVPKDGILIVINASYFANPLPVEVLPTVPVYGDLLKTGICICEVADYPLKALVFISKNLKALADVVAEICSTLHNHNSAFNLLISDHGAKIFLFPQVRTVLLECHLSAWECGGFFVYNTKSDFDHVSEVEILKRMASMSLDDHSFQALKQLCCNIANKLTL